MRRLTLVGALALLLLTLLPPGARAQQAPAWQAVRVVGSGGQFAEVRASAVDAAGNVYTAGNFGGTMQVGSTTLTSAGSTDVFITKWSAATGSYVWAVAAGGTARDGAEALVVSGGSVYVAGYFISPTASFGPTTLVNPDNRPDPFTTANLYVWKLTDLGATVASAWAVGAGSRENEDATALAVAGNKVYAGGHFVGPLTLGATTLPNAGNSSDVFVARLTDAGSTAGWDWAVGGGSFDLDLLTTLAVSGTTIYAGGVFDGPATFGPLTVANAGSDDLFVARLTDTGSTATYDWVQRAGGTGIDFLQAMAVRGNTLYVGGRFASNTLTFGSSTLTKLAGYDGFVAKLTDAGSTGTWNWAQGLRGAGFDNVTALAVRDLNVYVGAVYTGAATSLGSLTLTNAGPVGSYDLGVGSLYDAGATVRPLWALPAGGPNDDNLLTLTCSGLSLYAGGQVAVPASFGAYPVPGSGAGSYPAFVATILDTVLPTRAATDLPGVSIFPNPAPGAATVRVPGGAGAATVQVLDALGRVVRHGTVAAGQDYQLASLAPGLYAVRVQLGEATATRRLVVE